MYKSAEEEALRLAVFRDNWRLISEHNAADRPYKLGVNGEVPLKKISLPGPCPLKRIKEGTSFFLGC